ncbi:MAG: uroporphyrinogen-III synthase [Alphaproteobacteria bacterium]|nr:uroporphyrinogen-III synthase [Alphaproteobacteria bacterium]
MAARRRVLITRPAEDAGPLADALQARGFAVLIEPLLHIRMREGPAPDLTGVQALAFTSANGVRALVHAAPQAPGAGRPAFAVGPATAEAAKKAGFADVVSADGDVDALGRLIAGRLDAEAGAVLHVAGSHRAGDLMGRLEAAGFRARLAVLYDAVASEGLTPEVRAAIEASGVGWVLILSPRTAVGFVTLMQEAHLAARAVEICLVALSAAVAEAAAPLPWGEVRVAAAPRQDALLEALGRAPEGN